MSEQKITVPFVIAAAVWAAVGYGLCRHFSSSELLRSNLGWLFALWALCLFDLFALGKTVQGLLSFASGITENRAIYAIQTFSWGLLKLACVGIFALILIKGNLPSLGLLSGLGTLIVVPLLGGLIWSQSVLRVKVLANGA